MRVIPRGLYERGAHEPPGHGRGRPVERRAGPRLGRCRRRLLGGARRLVRPVAGRLRRGLLRRRPGRPRRPGARRRLRYRADDPGRRPAGPRGRGARPGPVRADDRRGPAAGGPGGAAQRAFRPRRRADPPVPTRRLRHRAQPHRGDVLRRPAGRLRQPGARVAARRAADPAQLATRRAQRVVRRLLDRADRPGRAAHASAGRAQPVLAERSPPGARPADRNRVRQIEISPHSADLHYGDAADAERLLLGLLGWMLRDRDDPDRGRAALRTSLRDHLGPDGVQYGSAAWLITAHRM